MVLLIIFASEDVSDARRSARSSIKKNWIELLEMLYGCVFGWAFRASNIQSKSKLCSK